MEYIERTYHTKIPAANDRLAKARLSFKRELQTIMQVEWIMRDFNNTLVLAQAATENVASAAMATISVMIILDDSSKKIVE